MKITQRRTFSPISVELQTEADEHLMWYLLTHLTPGMVGDILRKDKYDPTITGTYAALKEQANHACLTLETLEEARVVTALIGGLRDIDHRALLEYLGVQVPENLQDRTYRAFCNLDRAIGEDIGAVELKFVGKNMQYYVEMYDR